MLECQNCRGYTPGEHFICSDCISAFSDVAKVGDSSLIDSVAKIKISDMRILEQLIDARKLTQMQLHKQLFELPAGGIPSPQTRMNPYLLTLALGSVRIRRAVEVSSEWWYESFLEIVRAHCPHVECNNTDIYLKAVAFFVHVTGRYALEVGGDVFRNWLMDKIVRAWIKDLVGGQHPQAVNYITSPILQDNGDVNASLIDFIRSCEGLYESCASVTGSLLEDSIGQDTLIAAFHQNIGTSIKGASVDDTAVIQVMGRRIMAGILQQPWLLRSVADAVSES